MLLDVPTFNTQPSSSQWILKKDWMKGENSLDKNFRLDPTHVKKNESSYEKLMPSWGLP